MLRHFLGSLCYHHSKLSASHYPECLTHNHFPDSRLKISNANFANQLFFQHRLNFENVFQNNIRINNCENQETDHMTGYILEDPDMVNLLKMTNDWMSKLKNQTIGLDNANNM